MSYHYSKYEFLGPDSAGVRGGEVQFQVSEFFEPLKRGKTGKLQGYCTAPIWLSAFTPLNRPFPGAKLDVPRLAAPRGPARGRARANRPGLSYRMFESHSSAPRTIGAGMSRSRIHLRYPRRLEAHLTKG
eukprot:COSAG02_NODE_6397_length_3599_cov_8.635143_4_plen_130_part_00